jgi:ABC-type Fe3+ transport system substrate-binding protein
VLAVWTLSQPSGSQSSPQQQAVRSAVAAAPSANAAGGPSLTQLVEAARAEGAVEVGWLGELDDHWRQNFETAFNRQFGFRLTLRASPPSGDSAAGEKPPWDVLLSSQAEAAELSKAGRLGAYAWQRLLGTPSQAILFDGGAVAFAHQPIQPAYNTRRTPAASAPNSWESLLETRWTGRIGVSSAAGVWAGLSLSWGEDRTERFVRGLAALQPVRGAPGELLQKLEDGAIDVLAAIDDWSVRRLRDRGAAVAAASVNPVLLEPWVASPVKDGVHANAGVLFAGFLVTEEGQQLWQQYAGQSSVFIPGTVQTAVAGTPYVVVRNDPKAAARYLRLLGY